MGLALPAAFWGADAPEPLSASGSAEPANVEFRIRLAYASEFTGWGMSHRFGSLETDIKAAVDVCDIDRSSLALSCRCGAHLSLAILGKVTQLAEVTRLFL